MNSLQVLQRFEGLPFLLDVEVGTFDMPIREILALQEGSVLRTEHPAGEPLTLRAGGAPIALVEAAVVEDALSFRVKKMLHTPTTSVDTRPEEKQEPAR